MPKKRHQKKPQKRIRKTIEDYRKEFSEQTTIETIYQPAANPIALGALECLQKTYTNPNEFITNILNARAERENTWENSKQRDPYEQPPHQSERDYSICWCYKGVWFNSVCVCYTYVCVFLFTFSLWCGTMNGHYLYSGIYNCDTDNNNEATKNETACSNEKPWCCMELYFRKTTK